MSFGKNAAIAACVLASLSGCQEEPVEPAPAARLPAQLCTQARSALDKLSGSGAFEYEAAGTATINEAAWLAMGGNQRNALAQALAAHAACSAAEPARETEVVIRNEFGRVLLQRVVETSMDLSEILQ